MQNPIILTVAFLATSVIARSYVVAPNGSDTNSGKADAPFRTIGRAARVMQAGDTCLVKGGDYYECVTPASSGSEDKPIEIKAAPGERVILWGTEKLTGWTRAESGVWSAPMDWDLGKNNQLFIEGKPGHEARWPNRKGEDLLDAEGARVDAGGDDFITCNAFPSDWTADAWSGGVIWCMADKAWTSWTMPIKDFDAKSKTIHFEKLTHGSIQEHMNPGGKRESHFYLTGKRVGLDAPGEWFYDAQSKRMLLIPPEGKDPNRMHITAKRRMNVIEAHKRDYLVITGFEIIGATISLQNCNHCTLQGLKASYVSHTRGHKTSYGLNEDTGVCLAGDYNTMRDSEISWSVGDGVRISGHRNRLINCYVHHTDYMGAYGCSVKTSGSENLISWCTLHDTGRDCLQAGGRADIIEHCDIYHMGRMAHDLGGTYNCGSDGGGTEFRYNTVHDNKAAGLPMGIYLDNFTKNYFIHHNLCWNMEHDAVRLNKPSTWCVVFNNTLLGFSGNWGRWKTDWMYGCSIANNLIAKHIDPHPQLKLAANLTNLEDKAFNRANMRTVDIGVDKGIVIDGITDGFRGAAPDIGAFEQGVPAWKAGHDFENPPNPEYRLTDTCLRNLVQNGCFDFSFEGSHLNPWKVVAAAKVDVYYGQGGITTCYTERNSIISHAARISGGMGGISQELTGFKAGFAYNLACWVKHDKGTTVELRINGANNAVQSNPALDGWQHLALTLQGDPETGAVVEIVKGERGTAYIDEIGCVGVIPRLGIGPPGFATTNGAN